MRVLIHSLFADALDNGLIEKDPSKRLRIPRVAERPRKAFTMEEVKSIISYIMACPDAKMGTVVLTLLLTGLRRGELLGLKWSDLTDDTLTVNRAVYMDQGRPCVQSMWLKPRVASEPFRCCLSSLTGSMHYPRPVPMSSVPRMGH